MGKWGKSKISGGTPAGIYCTTALSTVLYYIDYRPILHGLLSSTAVIYSQQHCQLTVLHCTVLSSAALFTFLNCTVYTHSLQQGLLSSTAGFTVFYSKVYCPLQQCLLSSTVVLTVLYCGVYCPLLRCLLSPTLLFTVLYCGVNCPLLLCLLPPTAVFNVPYCGVYCPLLGCLLSPTRVFTVPYCSVYRPLLQCLLSTTAVFTVPYCGVHCLLLLCFMSLTAVFPVLYYGVNSRPTAVFTVLYCGVNCPLLHCLLSPTAVFTVPYCGVYCPLLPPSPFLYCSLRHCPLYSTALFRHSPYTFSTAVFSVALLNCQPSSKARTSDSYRQSTALFLNVYTRQHSLQLSTTPSTALCCTSAPSTAVHYITRVRPSSQAPPLPSPVLDFL